MSDAIEQYRKMADKARAEAAEAEEIPRAKEPDAVLEGKALARGHFLGEVLELAAVSPAARAVDHAQRVDRGQRGRCVAQLHRATQGRMRRWSFTMASAICTAPADGA